MQSASAELHFCAPGRPSRLGSTAGHLSPFVRRIDDLLGRAIGSAWLTRAQQQDCRAVVLWAAWRWARRETSRTMTCDELLHDAPTLLAGRVELDQGWKIAQNVSSRRRHSTCTFNCFALDPRSGPSSGPLRSPSGFPRREKRLRPAERWRVRHGCDSLSSLVRCWNPPAGGRGLRCRVQLRGWLTL